MQSSRNTEHSKEHCKTEILTLLFFLLIHCIYPKYQLSIYTHRPILYVFQNICVVNTSDASHHYTGARASAVFNSPTQNINNTCYQPMRCHQLTNNKWWLTSLFSQKRRAWYANVKFWKQPTRTLLHATKVQKIVNRQVFFWITFIWQNWENGMELLVPSNVRTTLSAKHHCLAADECRY